MSPRRDACFPRPTAAWCNTSLPFPARAALLVAALTLDEKIQQLSTFTPGTVPGVARVGLPPFSYHSEGLHGLRNSYDTLGLNATLFPQTTALAAQISTAGRRPTPACLTTRSRLQPPSQRVARVEQGRQGCGPLCKKPTSNHGNR